MIIIKYVTTLAFTVSHADISCPPETHLDDILTWLEINIPTTIKFVKSQS